MAEAGAIFSETALELDDLSAAIDSGYNNAAAKGYFPLSFTIANIDQNGPVATAFVTAASPAGQVASQPLTFIAGPSPTGWQLSKQSAMALISSVG